MHLKKNKFLTKHVETLKQKKEICFVRLSNKPIQMKWSAPTRHPLSLNDKDA